MEQPTRCPVCGGSLLAKPTTQDVRHGTELIVIENVPALVCQHCGEQWLLPGVMKGMDAILRARSEQLPIRSLEVPVFQFDRARAAV